MFGFPIGNGNAGFNEFVEKFTNNADSGFPKPQQREVFYSIKDGNWGDATVWQTASGRVGKLPTSIDDVYIRNNIIISASGLSCNNLFISKNLIHNGASSQYVFYVFGNLKFTPNGILDFRTAAVQQLEVYLYGNDNTITDDNLIYNSTGVNGIIRYARNDDQDILPLSYRNLNTSGGGTKWVKSDLNILGGLTINAKIEFSSYNLIVNGNTSVGAGGFSKVQYGSLLFIGQLQVQQGCIFDLSQGNANVELRGGLDGQITPDIRTGTGTWSFTTNSQAIFGTNGNCQITFNGNVVIGSGVTLTIRYCVVYLVNTINGVDGTSKLINGFTSQATTLGFTTQTAAENSLSIGTFDFTTYSTNIILYGGNYSATIPSRFPAFSSLTISGTGTKTLGVNTTVNSVLTNNSFSGGIFELSTYNLTVNGQTNLGATSILSKSGIGNVIFVGSLTIAGNLPTLNFSGGNPTVELRNGINNAAYQWTTFSTGTSQWTFSTNTQQIQISYSRLMTFDCPILISGAITLGISGIANGYGGIILNSTINGNNASSKLLVGGASATLPSYLCITNTSTIMATGIFDYTTSVYSVVSYRIVGNFTIPYSSYQGLEVNATGTKTLSANTTILTTLGIANGTLECSTYNLTVNGQTSIGSAGFIKKNSATGTTTFIGNLNMQTNTGGLDFSIGNASIEFRNGINMTSYTPSISTGTGTWTFSTNSQSMLGYGNTTFNCSILISGAITLTTTFNTQQPFFNGTINGNNAASTFLMGLNGLLTYQSATQPMATGVLNTSTNLNTWIYGNLNQDIKGSPTTSPKQVYRNLTLNGLGIKTLQGYVSVLNTYTLTAPATLVNNGFTLTNP